MGRTLKPVPKDDKLRILVCKIIVWESKKAAGEIDMDEPDDALIIRECESIEISESYKQLIGTATIRFPRGTIIKKTITPEQTSKDGVSNVYTERLANGAILEKRENSGEARPEDFKVGQRIRIYLSYLVDEGVAFKSKEDRDKAIEKALEGRIAFDGYIDKCSVSTPLEIKCENLASNLKRINCRKIKTGKHTTVNDLLKEGGKYNLLKGTGIKLHPETESAKIDVGQLQLNDDLTLADMFTEWNKYHVYCFIRLGSDGKPYLKVGRSYFTTDKAQSVLRDNDNKEGTLVQFDWDVAEDGLTLLHTDPKFLAVEATGFQFEGSGKNSKEVKTTITIVINPQWKGKTDTTNKKYLILSETKLSKKEQKLGAEQKEGSKKYDLSKYTVIPYVSAKIGITREELIKEAEGYFEGYNINGIEGTITVFGDVLWESGRVAALLDKRQPEKNGWYLVEEVNTKFGVNGYRQTLKLPYCIARPDKE